MSIDRKPGKVSHFNFKEEVYVDPELNARLTGESEESLRDLAASIQQTNGLLQPVGVVPTSPERKTEHGMPYELAYGYRRTAALGILDEDNPEYGWLNEVPAMVNEVDETRRLLDQLVENLYRKNMNNLEVAIQFKKILKNDPQMNQKKLAASIGYSEAVVSQYLKLTELCDEVQSLVLADKITYSAAKAIATLDLPKDQQILSAEVGANLPFGEFEAHLKSTYKKGDAGTEGAEEVNAVSAGAQKPATEGVRAKTLKDKYLPKFQELFDTTKDKREKEEMRIRIDTAKFLLREDGTEIGTKLAPWEEELVKSQKAKEEGEEKDRLRKKFIRQSVVMVNKITDEEPPLEAEVRTKKNVQQALAEIQATVNGYLEKGKAEGLPENTIQAGFVVDNIDVLMQDIHKAWKDAEEAKAKKREEAKKKREEARAKEAAEAEAAKSELVAVGA